MLKFKGCPFDVNPTYFLPAGEEKKSALPTSFKIPELRKYYTSESVFSGSTSLDQHLHKRFPGHLDWSALYGTLRFRIPASRRQSCHILSLVSPSFPEGRWLQH